MPNALIHESSPYLLQHAHQPVNWLPYSDKIFEIALSEKKVVLISIGYSTCHWCHVMAHESFDDTEVANLMNQYFICVKVDREELPDIDKYYMNGTQILTGRGGWPLNVFVLPNKKMFYGLTYLPKQQWIELLKKIHQLYTNEKNKLEEYAENIHRGIKQFELSALAKTSVKHTTDIYQLQESIQNIKTLFDTEWGGLQYVPKFVMPVNYKFFLQYAQLTDDNEIKKHLHKSIQNITLSGLFDHAGGGFYRYSTDRYWKIPHFEKMLYDNAQMIELLALYHLLYPSEEIQWILEKNIHCLLRDFYSDEYLFYSAWDADSENEEGKFYVWTESELRQIIQSDYDEFARIFNISNQFGYWEHDKYVLTINISLFNENKSYWIKKISQWTDTIFKARKKRIHPSVDTKIITSWNALTIKALSTAATVLNNKEYLTAAEKSMHSLLNKMWINQQLFRIYHHSKTKIPAYLDDYAFLIDALITLAKHTGNVKYSETAQELAELAINEFYSHSEKIFYYTGAQHSVADNIELYDDVIPSANAQMIKNLYYLSGLNDNKLFKQIADDVFSKTAPLFFSQPMHAASYGQILLEKNFYEQLDICIAGQSALNYLHKIYHQIAFINNIFVSQSSSNFSIFQNRFHPEKTFIYVCQHSACYEPIENFYHFNISDYISK